MTTFVDNPHLNELTNDDVLYHFGISRTSTDLVAIFGDTRVWSFCNNTTNFPPLQFVITGGSASRMKKLAVFFAEKLNSHYGKEVAFTEEYIYLRRFYSDDTKRELVHERSFCYA